MNHQSGRKKLNLKCLSSSFFTAQPGINFIENGHLVTTKARTLKEVQRFAEKLVTLARQGILLMCVVVLKSLFLIKMKHWINCLRKLLHVIVHRPGGYTRVIPLGRRASDTAPIAKLEWVNT